MISYNQTVSLGGSIDHTPTPTRRPTNPPPLPVPVYVTVHVPVPVPARARFEEGGSENIAAQNEMIIGIKDYAGKLS